MNILQRIELYSNAMYSTITKKMPIPPFRITYEEVGELIKQCPMLNITFQSLPPIFGVDLELVSLDKNSIKAQDND